MDFSSFALVTVALALCQTTVVQAGKTDFPLFIGDVIFIL